MVQSPPRSLSQIFKDHHGIRLRRNRDWRRAGGVCGGDPGLAARQAGALRGARQARRHLPQLGLHPHQGPAHQRPPRRAGAEPRQGVRVHRPGELGLRPDDRPQPQRRGHPEQGHRGPVPQVQGRLEVRRRQGRGAAQGPGRVRDLHRREHHRRHRRPPSRPAGCRLRRPDDHLVQGSDVATGPAQVDGDHRRRPDRPGIRLLLQRHRHQGHRRRDDGPHPPRRG